MRRCKLACMSLISTSGQFGESQTLRKSEAFSKWLGRKSVGCCPAEADCECSEAFSKWLGRKSVGCCPAEIRKT